MRPRDVRREILRKYWRNPWRGKLDGSLEILNRQGAVIRVYQKAEYDPWYVRKIAKC